MTKPPLTPRVFLALVGIFFLSACTESRQTRLIEQADNNSQKGQYAQAVDLLKKSVSLNPESKAATRALYKMGFILETYLHDYEAALFNYAEFTRLSADSVRVYEVQKRVANLYFENQQATEPAITAYKKLLSLNPDSLEGDLFQYRIGKLFFRMDNFEQARIELQQLIEKYPKSQFIGRARFDIGNAYYMEGKYEIAIEALKQALRQNPQSETAAEAQFLIGQCYELLEKPAMALTFYEGIRDKYTPAEILKTRIEEVKKHIKKEK